LPKYLNNATRQFSIFLLFFFNKTTLSIIMFTLNHRHQQKQQALFPIAKFLHLALYICLSTLLYTPQFQCSPILGAAVKTGAAVGGLTGSVTGAMVGSAVGAAAGTVVGGIKVVTDKATPGKSYTNEGVKKGKDIAALALGAVGATAGAATGACVGMVLEAGKACKNGVKKTVKKVNDQWTEKKNERAEQQAKQQARAK
jgi:hypothetical protein